ncbi:hypothetical protein KAI87_17165, partial [Myxococcota bacterium]|nr:hypothetical protein [Myxococcota bacterium]
DHHVYMKIKGSFKYEHDVKPQYAWWNGKTKRYLLGDTINPDEITNLTIPVGSKDDKDAKLWPFKVHVAKQPYDIQSKMLLVPNTVGPDGYWTLFDWDKAFKNGTKAVRESPDNGYDLQYTGEFGFAETETYWALSHMVTHAKDALSCEDCHGQNGRMKWSDLGYDADPLGRDELEHEEVTLKDADGEPVVKSGKALSMKTTCGECHELDDDNFKARHNFHKTELAETLSHEREKCLGLESLVPTDEGEMNCLICHLKDVNTRRMRENRGTDWMSAAGLSDDYLSKTQSGFEWNKETLGKEGTVELALIHTTEHTCGDCHGGTDKGEKFLKFELGKRSSWKTEETGEVFSGRRISNSGMNLEGKDKLVQPWDVHAERLVHCTDCHAATERPKRASHGKVLRKNQIKVGEPVQCLSCHNTAGSHNDLPNAPQHMGSVSCESCHIPKLHMAARQMVDETVVETNGESSVFYRGIKGGEFKSAAETLISGYTPTLGISLASGKAKIAPMNLISTWRWMDGEKKVVPAAMLAKVFLEGTTYKPVIIKALDKDSDGKVSRLELRLDSDAKVKIVADLLAKEGVKGAHIAAMTTTHAIHHNVMPAPFVKLRCERCHVSAEKSEATVEIAPYLPGGVKPTLDKNGSVKTSGEFKKNQDGSLIFVPTMVQDQFKKCRSLKDASK